MHKEVAEELRVRFKLAVLENALHFSATEACKEFNVDVHCFLYHQLC
jgi:hypothetical protein